MIKAFKMHEALFPHSMTGLILWGSTMSLNMKQNYSVTMHACILCNAIWIPVLYRLSNLLPSCPLEHTNRSTFFYLIQSMVFKSLLCFPFLCAAIEVNSMCTKSVPREPIIHMTLLHFTIWQKLIFVLMTNIPKTKSLINLKHVLL